MAENPENNIAGPRKSFRVAIRKFDPFASAIAKQWVAFQAIEGTDLTLEAVELDLHPLYASYFEQEGLKRGDWDVGFLVSDWFAAAREEGAIGCRKSTWADADVNATIPFYHKMEALHGVARELPRLSQWAKIAAVIDELVLAVINTDQPIAELVRGVQV